MFLSQPTTEFFLDLQSSEVPPSMELWNDMMSGGEREREKKGRCPKEE
jgi:hypothetical protein